MASAHGRAGGSLFSGLFSGFGSGGNGIGISIGATSVKVAEVKKKKNQYVLTAYAAAPIHDAFSEQREIVNPGAVATAIRSAMSHAGIKSKEVCSAVSGSGVIIKTLNIPVQDMKELNDQVFWEAEQYIPFDISEVVIDYEVIKKTKDNHVEVIVVAVKRDFIQQYRNALEQNSLDPKIMDVEIFALQNTYEFNFDIPETEAILLADVGAMSTKTVICSGGIPLFTKDSPYGGTMVTQEIQKELKLPSLLDAEALKTSGNLPHEVSEIVARTCHVLGAELKKSIDFYTASSLGPPVSAVYLAGGGSRSFQLSKIVEEYVGLPVLALNPFERVQLESGKFPDNVLETIGPEVTIPMGLAIRAGEGR